MKRMKGKGKGIVSAADVGFAPNLSPVPEDPAIRFRHHSLLQDYRDLQKETDAMRRKMEILIERKLTLLAEVQFLRSRYRYFMDNQISKPPQLRRNVKQKNPGMKNKAVKRKDPMTKAILPGMPVSGSNGNKKQKASTVKKNALPPANSKPERRIIKNNIVPCSSSMSLNSNQRDLLVGGMEVPLLNSQSTYELPQKQMLYQEVEATMRNPDPVFDLNEILEEELQTSNNQPRIEAAHKISSGGGIEDPGNESHLAVCRNRTNVKGPNKAGKRRISWQDQVAVMSMS